MTRLPTSTHRHPPHRQRSSERNRSAVAPPSASPKILQRIPAEESKRLTLKKVVTTNPIEGTKEPS